MSTKSFTKRRGGRRKFHLLKPNGVIHQRVQAVGPDIRARLNASNS